MARGKGYQGIVGVRVSGGAWGTALNVATSPGFAVLAASLDTPGNTEPIEDRSIRGRVTQREARAGNRVVDVTLATDLRYEGLEPLIALVMGLAGAPATVDVSARQHVFKIKDSLDGVFAALAYEIIKDTKVVEIPTVKWHSLTLRIKADASPELELKGIASDYLDSQVDTTINTPGTIDSVVAPANEEYPVFSQVAVRLNVQGGGALGAVDAVHVSEFEITIERQMARVYSTEFGNRTSEPLERGGFLKVSGSMKFDEFKDGSGGSHLFPSDQMALARKKADLTITSPTLAGAASQKYQHKLWLPNLQFGAGKPGISGPDSIEWTLPFTAYHVATVPTGFTAGYVDAVTWEVYSQRATDALAT